MDNVFIDEHFLQLEIIQESKRKDYIMKANFSMLPHIEDNARKEFLEGLDISKDELRVKENQATDFDAIKKAKEQLKMM
ncbi:hypothetical protein [Neobacillus mesonae]|uniref:hypothetical protein n=1 Tax=Neobacillus mesonae TaxID=1193713 RepID=UPI0025739B85|nr:hypothetical protein [Neobacillus mesonae]